MSAKIDFRQIFLQSSPTESPYRLSPYSTYIHTYMYARMRVCAYAPVAVVDPFGVDRAADAIRADRVPPSVIK